MNEKFIDELADKVLMMLRASNAIGAARAITQKRVAISCGTNTRSLQHATLRLNSRGIPVVSQCVKPFGMFIAETDAEIDGYIDQLHSRLVGNALREKYMRQIRRNRTAARTIEPSGQRRLFAS